MNSGKVSISSKKSRASSSKSVLAHHSRSFSPAHFTEYLKLETDEAFVWKDGANSRKAAVGVPDGISTGNLKNTCQKCYRLSQFARLRGQTFITECISPSLESILSQLHPLNTLRSQYLNISGSVSRVLSSFPPLRLKFYVSISQPKRTIRPDKPFY